MMSKSLTHTVDFNVEYKFVKCFFFLKSPSSYLRCPNRFLSHFLLWLFIAFLFNCWVKNEKKEEKHFLAFVWPFNDDEGTQVDTTLNTEVGTASSSMKRNYWRILPIVSPIVTPLKVHAIKDTYEVVSHYSIMQMVIKATTTAIIALITATTRASTTPTTTFICSDVMIRQKKLDHSICSTFVWFDALKQ